MISRLLTVGLLAILVAGCAKKEQPVRTFLITPIKCYSNGVLVFEGDARGDVWVSYDSPRVEFTSAETGRTVVVSGMCVVGE